MRGGGLLGVEIMPGDRIELATLEGGQAAELALFAHDGRDVSTSLGPGRPVEPAGIRAMLSADGEDAARIRGGLRRRGLDLGMVKAIRLFGAESPAGAEAAFTVGEAGYLLVAAPGAPMSPWDHDPPTDLLLFVRRATPSLLADERLPDPLADPRPSCAFSPPPPSPYRARRRVHPDHRRARAAMLRLRRLPAGTAGPWRAARDRQRHHAHAHRQRLSQAGPVLQVLRRGDEPAGRGRAGHRRPPRQLQPRLHRPLL